MAFDAQSDSSQNEFTTRGSAAVHRDSTQHRHEHASSPRDLRSLHATAVNGSYDRTTLQGQSTAIFGNIHGDVHYHIRPLHAIAQLPGRVAGQSKNANGSEPAVQGSNPTFPPWLLPFEQRDDFFGRADLLNEIEGTLFDQDSTLRRVAITGLGGAGKSRCAMEIAYRVRRKRPKCSIFWIQGTDLQSVQLCYRNIAEALQLCNSGDSPEKTMELVRSHLNSDQADEFLLVIDDADDSSLWVQRRPGPYSSQPLLMDYLPRSSKGAIILTTRSRQVAVQVAHRHVKELPMLDQKSASRLLRSHLTNTAGPNLADAGAVAQYLTCLPFVLVRAADFMNQTGTNLQTLLRLLQDNEEAVVELLSAGSDRVKLPNGKVLPVQRTWLVSIDSIKQHDEHAFDMLAYMSCLHHLSIPHEIVPTARTDFHQISAIGLLKGYGLILSADENDNNTMFDLHRLAQIAVRSWLIQRGKFESTWKKTVTVICDILKERTNRPLETCRTRALWPHVKQLYIFGRNSKIQTRCSLLHLAADLFQAREMQEEELACLNLLTQDTEMEDVLQKDHIGFVYERLGHLLLAQNSAISAEEWLRQAVRITLRQDEVEERTIHRPELVRDAILVWQRLGRLGAMMPLARRLVKNRLLAYESESQDTIDAVRTWIEACLTISHSIGLCDVEELVSLSKDRLGEADELTHRARCTLYGLQLRLPGYQKDKAFVKQALNLSDRVLGNESPQSAFARQLLEDIRRIERELEAQRIQAANERARQAEYQRISGSIDRTIGHARESDWPGAVEELSRLADHPGLLASRTGNDAHLLKAIGVYAVHHQGRQRESLRLAARLLNQTNGRLERALYTLLEDIACSVLASDPQTAVSFLLRIWNTGCTEAAVSRSLAPELARLLDRTVETLRERGQIEQAISLLTRCRTKRMPGHNNSSIKFSITDFLFPPGPSWPQWFPQIPAASPRKSGDESWRNPFFDVISEYPFRGNDELLLRRRYWEINEVIRRLELEAACPEYQRDSEQSFKTMLLLAVLYVVISIKTGVLCVGLFILGAVCELFHCIAKSVCAKPTTEKRSGNASRPSDARRVRAAVGT